MAVWFSVVFFGDHYVVDVIAGIALAAVAWWVLNRVVAPSFWASSRYRWHHRIAHITQAGRPLPVARATRFALVAAMNTKHAAVFPHR